MFNFSLISALMVVSILVVNVVAEEECFQLGETSLYNGTKSTTMSGLECQRWDRNTPHEQKYKKEMFPTGSLCEEQNFCRDPGNDGYLWCYTMNPYKRWEACGIPWCNEPSRNNNTHDCYILTEEDRNHGDTAKEMCEGGDNRQSVCEDGNVPDGCETCKHCCQTKDCYNSLSGYRGTWHRTESGRECQHWDEQSPNKHTYTGNFHPDGNVSPAQNYCRDPDNDGFLWCYSMDPNVRWEKCGIPRC